MVLYSTSCKTPKKLKTQIGRCNVHFPGSAPCNVLWVKCIVGGSNNCNCCPLCSSDTSVGQDAVSIFPHPETRLTLRHSIEGDMLGCVISIGLTFPSKQRTSVGTVSAAADPHSSAGMEGKTDERSYLPSGGCFD